MGESVIHFGGLGALVWNKLLAYDFNLVACLYALALTPSGVGMILYNSGVSTSMHTCSINYLHERRDPLVLVLVFFFVFFFVFIFVLIFLIVSIVCILSVRAFGRTLVLIST